MKKYLLALLFLPSIALATDTNNLTVTGRVITQRMDVSTMGKVVQIGFVDGSSQTTAGFVRFKDEGIYFMSGSTINCVGTAITCSDAGNGVTEINVSASGGGGGGGGGGGFIFTGATNVTFSTQSFPGATITSDGNGFSTVTYMPVILTTFTLLSNSTAALFLNLTSTGVSLGRLWTVTVSTWNAFTAFTSTTQAFTESANSTMTAIRQSTATFETRFNTFASTVTSQDEIFKGWASSNSSVNDTQNSTITAIRQSTGTFETRFNTFASTATSQDEIFKGYFASNSVINDLQNSSVTSIAQTLAQRTVVGYDEGSALSGGNVTAINWVGAAVTATQSGSTITATVTASGGGGGGSTSLTIFNGSALTSVSTTSFPGATISFDGSGMSTVTYMPAILSTYTALTSTGVSLSKNWDSLFSTWTAFNIFAATTSNQGETFKAWFASNSSINDLQNSSLTALAQTVSQRTVVYNAGITLTALVQGSNVTLTQSGSSLTVNASASGGGSPPTLQSPATGPYVLTSDAGTRYGIAASSGLEYGIGAQITTYFSTADARGNTFVNLRSTTDALFNAEISTIQALVRSTATIENRLSTATLVYNGGIAITALVQGANVTLTQSGSSVTVAASASGGGGGSPFMKYRRYNFRASDLVNISTPVAPLISTTAVGGQLPQLVRSLSESTTDFIFGDITLSTQIDINSQARIGFGIAGASSTANALVQMAFMSTGTLDGVATNLSFSTGADSCALGATMGQENVFITQFSMQSAGWTTGNLHVYFGVARRHDTSILGANDLRAKLYLKYFWIDVPETLTP